MSLEKENGFHQPSLMGIVSCQRSEKTLDMDSNHRGDMDDTAHSREKSRRKLITRVQKNAFSQTFFCNEVQFSSKIKARLVSRNLR